MTGATDSSSKSLSKQETQLLSRPWIEKYRPATLDEVAAHKEIIDTIRRLTAENRLPHLLLYGPPGTGKTSTILAVARQLYGKNMPNMTLELNASDDRGIQTVRQEIQDFASTQSIFSNKFKLVILDECDAMTKDAQFALRRVIERYTRNTRFCLICNYVSKIIPALQSRCTKFRFPPLEEAYIRTRVTEICQEEGVSVSPCGLDALIATGAGDMRKTLNILQSVHMASGDVEGAGVYSSTGNPSPSLIAEVARWLLNDSFRAVFDKIQGVQRDQGLALMDIVGELHPWLFRINMPPGERIKLVAKLADVEARLAVGTSEKLQLGSLVAAFTMARPGIGDAAAAMDLG